MGLDFDSEEFKQMREATLLKLKQERLEWEKQQAAERKEWNEHPNKWVEHLHGLGYPEEDIFEHDGGVVIRGADGKQVWFDPVYLTKLEYMEYDFEDTSLDMSPVLGDVIFSLHDDGFDKMKQELAEYEVEARRWDRPQHKRPTIDDPTKYRVIE